MYESDFERNEFPLAYLITIRCYGTWLHGDARLSVDRHGLNVYGRRRRKSNSKLEDRMKSNMRRRAVVLNERQRELVEQAVREVCGYRYYDLWAVNVRTNHFHAVVSAAAKPEPIADAFKSYSTRKLREAGLIEKDV